MKDNILTIVLFSFFCSSCCCYYDIKHDSEKTTKEFGIAPFNNRPIEQDNFNKIIKD